MSDLQVALVAEGPTDAVIVEAALKAILPRPFTIKLLQPDATRKQIGSGWCGVFKWCREFAASGYGTLEADPTLLGFDLLVIHLDADVAEFSYAHGGAAVKTAAQDLPVLPCPHPRPPPRGAADEVRKRILAWLGIDNLGPKTVLCVPSKAVEAWLAASVLDASHVLLIDIESNLDVATPLAVLPLKQRIKKTKREYQARASTVSRQWPVVCARCSQAQRFSQEVAATNP